MKLSKKTFTCNQPWKYISYYQLKVNTGVEIEEEEGKTGIQFDEKGEFTTEKPKIIQAMTEFAKFPNNVEVKQMSKRDLITEITDNLEMKFSKHEIKDGKLVFIREYENDLVIAITTTDKKLIEKFEE